MRNNTVTAFYLRDMGNALLTATDDGREVIVHKWKLASFHVAYPDVTLTYKAAFAPDAAAFVQPSTVRQRKCLVCSEEFTAKAKFRVCNKCKSTQGWY